MHATKADERTDRRPWYHAATGIDRVYPNEPRWTTTTAAPPSADDRTREEAGLELGSTPTETKNPKP